MTVSELHRLLFDTDNQNAVIVIVADGCPCDISTACPSEID